MHQTDEICHQGNKEIKGHWRLMCLRIQISVRFYLAANPNKHIIILKIIINQIRRLIPTDLTWHHSHLLTPYPPFLSLFLSSLFYEYSTQSPSLSLFSSPKNLNPDLLFPLLLSISTKILSPFKSSFGGA